ncbi:MAG: hypothetical protein GXP32_05640, partial [Kiritimatiellaeota bacterium]|nr:hypothetical protein [Kiritimatiellota bacterium]
MRKQTKIIAIVLFLGAQAVFASDAKESQNKAPGKAAAKFKDYSRGFAKFYKFGL